MPRKRVRLTCHEPFAVDPTQKQPWADVYVMFKTRPGRRGVPIEPTLMSRSDLERTVESMESLAAEHPGMFADDVVEQRALLARVVEEGIVIDANDDQFTRGLPDIYTSAWLMDRAEAERMLRVLLLRYGIRQCRFDWVRPDLVIIPT
jgi:hypothetical protein